MSDALSAADRDLIRTFEGAGQGHVFRFLPKLAAHEARALLAQAAAIDLGQVRDLARRLVAEDKTVALGRIEPPGDELLLLPKTPADRKLRAEAEARGLDDVKQGRVAVVVAA